MLDDLLEGQCLGPPLRHSQHIHSEGILKTRLLVEQILQILDVRAALKLDDDPDPLFGGLVGNISDGSACRCFCQRCHVIQEFADPGADHRIGDLRDNQPFLAASGAFDFHFAAQADLTHTGLIDLFQFGSVGDNTAGREIRTFDILHQFLRRYPVVIHIGFNALDDLAQIVRGNAGCHTDRDTFCSVDQEIRHSERQHHRFLLCLIEVRHEIDDIFFHISERRFLRKSGQTRLGITHCCGSIPLDRTEIAVTVDQDLSLFEILRHHDQGIIDR